VTSIAALSAPDRNVRGATRESGMVCTADVDLELKSPCRRGEMILLAAPVADRQSAAVESGCAGDMPDGFSGMCAGFFTGGADGTGLKAGAVLHDASRRAVLRVTARVPLVLPCMQHAAYGYTATVLEDLPAGRLSAAVCSPQLTAAWVTLSDKGAAGLRTDSSGPAIGEMFRGAFADSHVQGYLLPDEGAALKALLTDLALTQRYDVVFTTGGTGLGPRDVTPEATLAVIEKRLHGFEQAMMAASLCKTPHAVISRAVAGTLGTCIIINMPGSRKAVLENMQAVLPALAHASAKLRGDKADCGT